MADDGTPQTAAQWASDAGIRWNYSPATRHTLLALAHFIELDNDPCPSFKDLTERTGRSLATTQKAIQRMEYDGVIIRVQRAGRVVKGGLTCHYTLVGYAFNLPIPERTIVSLPQYPVGEYVYLLRTELNHFKIGCTINPAARMQTFITTLPISAEYVCLIRCQDRLITERELHSRFASKRKQGEWFDLTPDDVEYIKSLAVES